MDRPKEKAMWPYLAQIVVALMFLFFFRGNTPRETASYLVGFLFFVTLGVGSLFFVLFQHLTRAGWGVTIRRQAEHLSFSLLAAPILFIPIALHLDLLYSWTDPAVAGHRAVVLNPTAFLIRSWVYLLLWAAIAAWFRRGSLAQDASGDVAQTRRLQTASAPALILMGLSLTLAAFDWVMSLTPHWYSTIFGVYLFSGAVVGGFAAIAIPVTYGCTKGDLGKWVSPVHLHHHGKLLFAFVVFWAYIGFSQFLLIWYGNLPEETVWFAARLDGGWRWVTYALVVGHFIVPFALLLSVRGKVRGRRLSTAAIWILAMHYLDLLWLVVPAVAPGKILAWSDLRNLFWIGILMIFLAGLAARRGAPIPEGDPRLGECLADEG